MASNSLLILFALAAFLAPLIVATEFIVGDGSGWTNTVDYQAWAEGKTFHVGDTLGNISHHLIFLAFQQCLIPLNGALETGNDVITLATSGKKWYICGKGKHCEVSKQKLAITVENASPAPAPGPPSSGAVKLRSSGAVGLIVAAFVSLLMKYFVL